ncbi:MAG: OmpA family protein [Ectothiorhodospiraceae bacterium]|jgi:outer membrane protein OmpA-like peptidoglycan-associated protein
MNRNHLRTTALAAAVALAPLVAAAKPLPRLPVSDLKVTEEPQTSAGDAGAGVGFGAGGFVGAAVAGPAGLVVGAALGSAVGDAVETRGDNESLRTALADANGRAARLDDALASSRASEKRLRQAKAELSTELSKRSADARIQELSGALSMDVLFRTDSDRLAPRARDRVAGLARLLQRYPDLSIELVGHADQRGTARYNKTLSARRARAVMDALASAGVDRQRIRVRSVGESGAEAAPGDADGLALDRRVAVRLTPFAGKENVASSH